jgi:hypothetical protein
MKTSGSSSTRRIRSRRQASVTSSGRRPVERQLDDLGAQVPAAGLHLLAEAARLVCAAPVLGAGGHDAAAPSLTDDQTQLGEVTERLPHDAA